jgi:hypothetical protein
MATNKPKKNYDTKYELTKKEMAAFEGWTVLEFISLIRKLQRTIERFKAREKRQGVTVVKANIQSKTQAEPVTNSMYKKTWPYATKVLFMLLREQRPLTTEDVNNFILKIDIGFRNYTDPRMFITNVMSQMEKTKRLAKVKVPGIATGFYLLPEWMDENGLPKENYQPVIDIFK